MCVLIYVYVYDYMYMFMFVCVCMNKRMSLYSHVSSIIWLFGCMYACMNVPI